MGFAILDFSDPGREKNEETNILAIEEAFHLS